jgi:hypothetical protein
MLERYMHVALHVVLTVVGSWPSLHLLYRQPAGGGVKVGG